MTDPGFPIAAAPAASVARRPLVVATCGECGVPLAPDQRYCISCGARYAPLPANLIAVVAAAAAGEPAPASDVALVLAGSPESRAAAFLATLPSRAAALAVMSMLAFGVVVGSAATSLANSSSGPLILAYAPPHAAASTPVAPAPSSGGGGGGGGGSSSGGGGTTTVVQQAVAAQTVTAPGAGSGGGGGGAPAPAAPTGSTLPPVKHVFIVMLSSRGYSQLYGPGSAFPYLAHTLRRRGELLVNYFGVAGSPLANGVAMISGQGPTPQTMLDCPQYTAITPGTPGKGKQIQGDGCVYPVTAQNLPDQLTANGQTWKAYVEGMSTAPAPTSSTSTSATTSSQTTTSGTTSAPPATTTTGTTGSPGTTAAGGQTACRHPNLGTADAAQTASAASPYVTWRNPFVYFQSITQSASCAQQDVSLERLAKDLRHERTTPSLAYIAPSPCDDGSEVACAPGQPVDPRAAAAATDAFLKAAISEIQASPAYRNGGLIAITSDNAPQSDPSACCSNPVYPTLSAPTTTSGTTTSGTTTSGTTTSGTTTTGTTTTGTTTTGTTTTGTGTTTGTTSTPTTTTTSSRTTTAPVTGGQTTATGGGGQVGMLLLSKYVKPGSQDTLDYFNHYSLLGSIEQLFSLSRLGYAAEPQLTLFTTGVVYNAYTG